jgi:hypothetical protein
MFESYTFVGSDVAQDVRDKFGDAGSVQITDLMLLRWINDGQREIASDAEFIQGTASTNLIAGQAVYDLTALFTGTSIRSLTQIVGNGHVVKMIPFTEYQKLIDNTLAANAQTQDEPINVAVWGGALSLWPTPKSTIAGGLVIYYTAYPTDLTALTDALTVPDRYNGALQDYVFAQALELDENFEDSQAKLGHFNTKVQLQRGRLGESPDDGYATITFVPEDDYYGHI